MATLYVNGENLPRLSRRIVERLKRGTMGYEALMGWTGSTHQSVAKELHKLKVKGLVEHDGCRPRTWALKGQLPKPTGASEMLLGRDLTTRQIAQNACQRKFASGFLPPDLHAAKQMKKSRESEEA